MTFCGTYTGPEITPTHALLSVLLGIDIERVAWMFPEPPPPLVISDNIVLGEN